MHSVSIEQSSKQETIKQKVCDYVASTISKELGLDSLENKSLLSHKGESVVIGVVSFGGLAFTNSTFLHPDNNTTRIHSIWDQRASCHSESVPNITKYSDNPMYGRIITKREIDRVLEDDSIEDKYYELNYELGNDSQGTSMVDIIAGSHKDSAGIAPKASIVYVHMDSERSFCSSVTLIEAVEYIFKEAETLHKSCIIALGLSGLGGPYNGKNAVERAFDSWLQTENNRAIVIAAGSSNCVVHLQGRLETDETILQKIPNSGDSSQNEIEIWYLNDDEISFRIVDSANEAIKDVNGDIIDIIEFGKLYKLKNGYIQSENRKKLNVLHISYNPQACTKDLFLEVRGINIQNGGAHGIFNFWVCAETEIHIADIPENVKVCSSLCSISSGEHTIVVGPNDTSTDPDVNINERPFDNCTKPEICALSSGIHAATFFDTFEEFNGTSASASVVAGLIALIFDIAQKENYPLKIKETREFILDFVRTNSNQNGEWMPNRGYGELNAKILDKLPFFKKV